MSKGVVTVSRDLLLEFLDPLHNYLGNG